MVEVVWSAEARDDLRSIADYIAKDSIRYAQAVVARLIHASERLGHFPRSGRIVPELQTEDIRETVEGNYRILYLTSTGRCTIITIVHSRQSIQKRFIGG